MCRAEWYCETNRSATTGRHNAPPNRLPVMGVLLEAIKQGMHSGVETLCGSYATGRQQRVEGFPYLWTRLLQHSQHCLQLVLSQLNVGTNPANAVDGL